ncbi:MAG: glycosyltransferase [Candidatus Hydrogenedentota bacterium]
MSEERRLEITPGMRAILDYPRFRGNTRLLVLDTGYFFDQSWVRAAKSLGWAVTSVASAMVGGLTREQISMLFTTIGEFKPDFILTSNYAGMDTQGVFARFFEDARIPYVSWFTDTPRMILFGREMHLSPYSVAATWERAYTRHFEAIGFPHVFFMPHATDPALFNGMPADSWEREVAFVGTSMVEQTSQALEKHEHLPCVVEAVKQAFAEGRVTRETYVRGMAAILGDDLLAPLNTSERRNVELLINYEATRRQREALASSLAPLGIEVRGDAYWKAIVENAGPGLDYFNELAPFFCGTQVNVNSTSLQMRWAVNQRVFDCPAAGGFLITDDQADMGEFFEPDVEAVTYRSLDELRDKVVYYLAHPEARRAVVHAARERILAEHTHAHRLEALDAFVRAHYA